MVDKKKSFLLRIPPDLWEDLNRWARDELRSLNAQIEFVLREATRRRARRPGAPANAGGEGPHDGDAENPPDGRGPRAGGAEPQ